MQVEGYAIVDRSGISVSTVSPTRRGALVNWLVLACGVPITNRHTDSHIEALWNVHAPHYGAVCERVLIRVAGSSG